jgi:hypothetical protein
MGNLTLPTPVAVAGGAICLLGGYLIGTVAGPDAPTRTTGVVVSYDNQTSRLCLEGGTVSGQVGASPDGALCGTWRRSEGSGPAPERGDSFRFVSIEVDASGAEDAEGEGPVTVIYGDVVDE